MRLSLVAALLFSVVVASSSSGSSSSSEDNASLSGNGEERQDSTGLSHSIEALKLDQNKDKQMFASGGKPKKLTTDETLENQDSLEEEAENDPQGSGDADGSQSEEDGSGSDDGESSSADGTTEDPLGDGQTENDLEGGKDDPLDDSDDFASHFSLPDVRGAANALREKVTGSFQRLKSGEVCYIANPAVRRFYGAVLATGTVVGIGALGCYFIYPEVAAEALGYIGATLGSAADTLSNAEAAGLCIKVGGDMACNMGSGGGFPCH